MSEFMSELEQEVDFDMRAPYIPMNGDTDLIFGVSPIPLFHNFDEGPKTCMGITETVFTPRPPELCPQPTAVPLAVLKEQTMREQMPKLPVGEVGMCPPKIKRPVETNRLETGPPAKIRCMEEQPRLASPPSKYSPRASPDAGKVSTSSVLMNLLLSGEDEGHGYRAKRKEQPMVTSYVQAPTPVDEVAAHEETVTSTVPETPPPGAPTDAPSPVPQALSPAPTVSPAPSISPAPAIPPNSAVSPAPAGSPAAPTFSAITLDAATLEQLQKLIASSGSGSGAVVILTSGGTCTLSSAGPGSPGVVTGLS